MKRFRDWVKGIWKLHNNPMVKILPGQIAFFLILSIFPLLMLIGCVASLFDVSLATLIETIENSLPHDIAKVLIAYISGRSFDTSIGLSMLIGFILASNGAYAIVMASNALYEFPPDDFVKRRVKSFFLIVVMVLLFAFIIVVLAYGNFIAKAVINYFDLENYATTIYMVFNIAKWPIAMILIYFTIKLVYTIAPDWQILSKNTTKGALFTTAGWIIATAVFSYYVSHFSHYDIFYGSLSSIIILMIWVYVLSYILVLGIAINVKEYRDKEES